MPTPSPAPRRTSTSWSMRARSRTSRSWLRSRRVASCAPRRCASLAIPCPTSRPFAIARVDGSICSSRRPASSRARSIAPRRTRSIAACHFPSSRQAPRRAYPGLGRRGAGRANAARGGARARLDLRRALVPRVGDRRAAGRAQTADRLTASAQLRPARTPRSRCRSRCDPAWSTFGFAKGIVRLTGTVVVPSAVRRWITM